MKTKFTLLAALIFCVSFVFAQKTTYTDSWGKQGLSLTSASTSDVLVNYSIKEFSLEDMELKGEDLKTLMLPGHFLPNNEGAPNLPGNGRYIAIPQGAKAIVKIVNSRVEKITGVEIAPAPRIPLDTDNSPLHYEKDQGIYSKNQFYPENTVQLSEPTQIRGVDAVMLGVTPFQYNPVTKELLVYRDLEVEISFEGGNGQFGDTRYRSRYWDRILFDAVLNPASLPQVDYSQRTLEQRTTDGCEYLIVSPNDPEFQQWADSIRNFRIQQGITTEVYTISEIGGNNVVTLENFFNDAYNNWTTPPTAVLLLGDFGTNGDNTITSPIYNNYCVSDNIFADVNGDHMPEMIFARITARNAGELEVMVTKFIDYERTPPTNPDFYAHPITALGWQTERWFQICSETVGGFFKNEYGKDPVRINEIYSGSPGSTWSTAQNTSTVVNYFGPNGLGYIPATPSTLGGWSGGNATQVNNAINDGCFLLQHRDHGMETGWGEPAYTNSNINGLNNTDLTFIMSINCLTGKYNWSSECFTEKFHRYTSNGQNSGALGLIAASEISYSFVNDTYVWGFYDNLWPDFMPDYGTWFDSAQLRPAFGNAAGKYYLQQSNWPYNTSNKTVTYNLFHHHGGAFLTLYSEVPVNLDIQHAGVVLGALNYFTIQATEGAIIALTVGDQIIGTGVGAGLGVPVDVPIIPQNPGTEVRLTITKTNYFRHSEMLQTISPDGAYCLYDSFSLNDNSGNGNGFLDFGESVLATVVIENLGNSDATGATVTFITNDPYVTLYDSTEVYGVIPANDTISVPDAFAFEVAGNVPDAHMIQFDITVTDDQDSTWSSQCAIMAMAPVLEIVEMEINDTQGGNGNGRLDPGETAELIVKNSNSGHCLAFNSIAYMETFNQYVTLTNTVDTLGTIGFFGYSLATFEVTVDPDAPSGSILVDFEYELVSGDIIETEIFKEKIGLLLEDWETGDFEKFPWEHDGNQPWEIVNQYTYEGFYSAKSGQIIGNQTSELIIDWEVMYGDSITFVKKVSSAQANKLKFYIGNSMKGEWSGTGEGWEKVAFYVEPGQKTFKWVYDKVSANSTGGDCVWIDYIEMPSLMVLTAYAGADDESCIGSDYQCQGSATDYASVEWSTSGTGTFDDINVLQPLYTPSQEDYDNGSVVLTLTATDSDGETADDEMTLGFIDIPIAPDAPSGPDAVDVFTITNSDYMVTPVVSADSYGWAIEPAEAGTIDGTGTTGTVTWNPDYTGTATITAKAINDCGEGDWSEGFDVVVYSTVAIDETVEGLGINVYPNPSTGSFNVILKSEEARKINIRIYSIVGSVVYQLNSVEISGEFYTTFDLGKYPEGLYFLNIEGEDVHYNKKMIIQK